MKNLFYPLIAFLVLLTSGTMAVSLQEYKVASGHSIAFDSKDPSGIFQEMSGEVKFDKDDLANSHINFSVAVASISTGNGMKNRKSLTSQWFDEANHPKITFVSKKIERTEKGYYAHGNMTIKGVKRYRKIPMNVSQEGAGMKFSGVFWVDRTFYKVGKEGGVVPSKMKITYSIPLLKK